MAWQRIRAAGPGKFSAKLRMRTPFRGRMVAVELAVDVGLEAGLGLGAVAMAGPAAVEFCLLLMIEAIMQALFPRASAKGFH
jgi:hypothetical protein